MALIAGLWKSARGGAPAAAPTAALYFSDPLQDLIGRRAPIRRLTPTLFACGAAAVVVRYGGARELALVRKHRFARVYLVIDDDLFALGEGDGLPADYRRRLLAYRDGGLAELLAITSHVVAPSRAILAAYPGKTCLELAPACCHAAASLAHHGNAGSPFRLVIAATRSHLEDVEQVAHGIAHFLADTPSASLTTLLGHHAPQALQGLANARHLAPLPWPAYRRFVAENRFHLGLAPARDTAFNRARSLAKLHDHAGLGAAGLYGDLPPFAEPVAAARAGLLLPPDPEAWHQALTQLAANRALTARLAASGQTLSQRLGEPERVRRFWQEQLGLPSP